MNSVLGLSRWGRQLAKKLAKPNQKFKPVQETNRWNIVANDLIRVINGPQTGQQGKVLQVLRAKNRVIVEGVNMRRRRERSKIPGLPQKFVIKPCSIHYSNVMLVDPSTGEPTKIVRRFLEDGTKVRVSKKTGTIIPKPDPLARRKTRTMVAGLKDTAPDSVFKVTFNDYEKYLPYIYSNLSSKTKSR